MKNMIYFFSLILFYFNACNKQSTEPDSQKNSYGTLIVVVVLSDAPYEVVRLQGKFENNAMLYSASTIVEVGPETPTYFFTNWDLSIT